MLRVKLVLVDLAVTVVVVVLEVRVDAVGVGAVAVDLHLVRPGVTAGKQDRASARARPRRSCAAARSSRPGTHSSLLISTESQYRWLDFGSPKYSSLWTRPSLFVS